MAEKYFSELTEKTTPSTTDLFAMEDTSGNGFKINYDKLAEAIVRKATTTDLGNKSVVEAINTLNSNFTNQSAITGNDNASLQYNTSIAMGHVACGTFSMHVHAASQSAWQTIGTITPKPSSVVSGGFVRRSNGAYGGMYSISNTTGNIEIFPISAISESDIALVFAYRYA